MRTKTTAGILAVGAPPLLLAFGGNAFAEEPTTPSEENLSIILKNVKQTKADDCVDETVHKTFQAFAKAGLRKSIEGEELKEIKDSCVASTGSPLGFSNMIHSFIMMDTGPSQP